MASSAKGLLDKAWEATQVKVFSRWVQKQLLAKNLKFTDVQTEFDDGTKLCALLEAVGKKPIGQKWNPNPKLLVQKRENIAIAIEHLTGALGVRVVGIDADAIINHNVKLTLGLAWSIILKFQIEDISVEEATARDALLLWVQKNTQGYDGVNVKNFSTSFAGGLPFAALINKFRSDKLDYNALDKGDGLGVTKAAFDAMKDLNIFVYLDPEDVATEQPDDKSIITQVSELFIAFSKESKTIAMADKIKRTIALQKELKDLEDNYAKLAQGTLDSISEAKDLLTSDNYEKNVAGVKGKLREVVSFNRSKRPEITEKKEKTVASWSIIQNKRKSAQRKPGTPPPGLESDALNEKSVEVEKLAISRKKELQDELHQIIDSLLNDYNQKAAVFVTAAHEISENIKALAGSDRENRQTKYDEIKEQIQTKKGTIDGELVPPYEALEKDDLHLDVENPPDVVHNLFNSLLNTISELQKEIDVEIAAEKGFQIPTSQLHEFRVAFETFDKDNDNRLFFYELHGALTYLGETTTDDECKVLIEKYQPGAEGIEFDPFLRLVQDRFSKSENKGAIIEAFQTLSNAFPVINDSTISQYFNEDESGFLKKEIPPTEGGYNASEWVDNIYANE